MLHRVVVLLCTFSQIKCAENVDKISEHQVFRYNEDVSVNTLDPIYIKSQSEIWIGSQIYEGLVSLNDSLLPIPQLAKSWEITDSGCVYKFLLKPQVFFHFPRASSSEPEALTAQHAAASLYRLLDPQNASPGAWILNDKMDIPEALRHDSGGRYRYVSCSKHPENPIYAPNDSTLILRLHKPFPAFLSLLSTNFAWITPFETESLSIQPRGTGPFFLKRWETDVKMILRKNTRYHEFEKQHRLPYMESVAISFVKSKQTAFMQFMAKQYDFFNGVEASYVNELLHENGQINPKYKPHIHALIGDFLNTEYIGFYLGSQLNGKPNPYQDVHLRKALQHAVDPQALIKYLRNGLGTPGHQGFVPPILLGSAAHDPFFSLGGSQGTTGFSISQAQNHLKQSAYYHQKERFAPLVLSTTQDYLDMAIFLQNSWKRLGLSVDIEVHTGGMLRQLRNAGKLGMFRGSWIADYPDPENYLACFYSDYKAPNGPNYTHFESKYFDSLFQNVAFGMASTASEVHNRTKWAREANQITHDSAPVIVLFYDKSVRLIQKNVQGLGNDPINRLELKRVRKLKTGFEKGR